MRELKVHFYLLQLIYDYHLFFLRIEQNKFTYQISGQEKVDYKNKYSLEATLITISSRNAKERYVN